MKLYKITSPDGCGLYRKFCEYPKLMEIARHPEQYTVTECYLNGAGQVYRKRSISTANYSSLVDRIHGEKVSICYPEYTRIIMVYEERRGWEAAADYLTRPSFADGTSISKPQLFREAWGDEIGVEYHTGPYIVTMTKRLEKCTLDDVKKFEFSDDDYSISSLIHSFDWYTPEWRRPCFRAILVTNWIEDSPVLKARICVNKERELFVPWHIRLVSGGDKIDIGKELLA